jgi:hypothetical protein
VVLERTFGITTATNPAALYAAMACTNGVYIATHTWIRGLSRAAVVGNLFRSVLSIPIAVALNASLAAALGAAGAGGAAEVAAILQKWAAIVSKAASDTAAGVIEGLADRWANVRTRVEDYSDKLRQLFDIHAQLELLYPETDVLDMLASPKQLIRRITSDLEKILIVNALDLFHFWMYPPRARHVLRSIMRTMSHEERQIVVRSQYVLRRNREVTQLFVDGIVGKRFARALSLYLDHSAGYLDAIERLAEAPPAQPVRLAAARSAVHVAEPTQAPRYSRTWSDP